MGDTTCDAGCCGSYSRDCCTFSPSECNRSTNSVELSCSAYGQPTVNDLTRVWETSNCISNYNSIMYDLNQTTTYDPSQLARLQGDVANIFTTYTSCVPGEGYCLDFTSDANSFKYNPFQDYVLDLCSSTQVPGICDLALTNYCLPYANERDYLSTNPVKASLCGCYINPLYPNPDVTPACDSICHMTQSSQKADPVTGEIDYCSNTVCVIDNNNIALTNTSTSTAYTQICGGCDTIGGDPCVCIIGGNPSQTITDAGIAPIYNQYCGTNSLCYQTTNGVAVQVPCPSESSFGFDAPSYNFPLVLICIIVFVVIILIVIFAATRGRGSYIEVKKEVPYTGPNYDNPQQELTAAAAGMGPRTYSTQFKSSMYTSV